MGLINQTPTNMANVPILDLPILINFLRQSLWGTFPQKQTHFLRKRSKKYEAAL